MYKSETQPDKIEVETRVLIDNIEPIEEKLKELGAKFQREIKIIDEHYADLNDLDPDKHTYEKTGEASRIRYIQSDDDSCIEISIRKMHPKIVNTSRLHDATTIEFFENFSSEYNKEKLLNVLTEKGFPEFITKIIKTRKIYTLSNSYIYLDNIETFGPALEIKNYLDNENEFAKTKKYHLELLNKLNILESEIIITNTTHLIIDSKIKRDPKIKIPMLEKKLLNLEKQKKELMLKTHEYATNEGDGWHDNSALDKLYDDVSLLTIRIRNLKNEIFEAKKARNK